MTIYYVRKSGSDGNAGTSPAAAWLTISKALGASGIASGDTVYIGPGVYREMITCNLTSPSTETFVIGDIYGVQTGDTPGEVRISNYATNDTTAPATDNLLNLNGKDHLTFQYLTFFFTMSNDFGAGEFAANEDNAVWADAISQYIKFLDCAFYVFNTHENADATVMSFVGAIDTPLHLEINRCRIYKFSSGDAITINCEFTHTVDFDADILIENSMILNWKSTSIQFTAAPFWDVDPPEPAAGGLICRNNIIIASSDLAIYIGSSSSVHPSYLYNNIIGSMATDYAVYNDIESTGWEDAVIEDYNYFLARSTHETYHIDAGANSITDSGYAFVVNTGEEAFLGQSIRPFLSPSAGSPLLGFGNHASAPDVDILNRPRPASLNGDYSMNAVGCYERHDTGVGDSSVFDSPPTSMKIIGAGDHDFQLAVDPITTNITVMVRYDTNHGSTNKPQVQLLSNPTIGVTAETKTMTEAEDTWEKLEFTSFVPTDYGVVTLRCVSRSTAGNGIANFDTITS